MQKRIPALPLANQDTSKRLFDIRFWHPNFGESHVQQSVKTQLAFACFRVSTVLMTALRIRSAVAPGWKLVSKCGPRFTPIHRSSTFGSTPIPASSSPRRSVLAALPASLPCCFTLSCFQRDTVARSSLSTQQAVAMSVTQDHSSFANYWQAAVTHIDLGKHCVHPWPVHDHSHLGGADASDAACRLVCAF